MHSGQPGAAVTLHYRSNRVALVLQSSVSTEAVLLPHPPSRPRGVAAHPWMYRCDAAAPPEWSRAAGAALALTHPSDRLALPAQSCVTTGAIAWHHRGIRSEPLMHRSGTARALLHDATGMRGDHDGADSVAPHLAGGLPGGTRQKRLRSGATAAFELDPLIELPP